MLGVKKAPQALYTRRVFIGTIPIDIAAPKMMMTSYLEEVTTPKTSKVEFVKPSASSTPTIVSRTLQIREATPPPVLGKGWSILPSRSQSQSDLTSEGVRS